jgi:FkbH-like protein
MTIYVSSEQIWLPTRNYPVSDSVGREVEQRSPGRSVGKRPMNAIDKDVKMIIWDLDDTLWRGTLAEGGVQFIAERAEIVKALAGRGIISSIASKNDYGTAKALLENEGLWEYFVFPSITFDPKGKRVAQIIENAALRPQNVLFIDDNVANLEEARFFSDGIMLATPDALPDLLAHPCLSGKPDPGLGRLKQYQLLQRKVGDRENTDMSNEDFLRSSDIRISFDFDVASHFDRVVELINRTNQLNYTKKRLATVHDIDLFRSSLMQRGLSAACISCWDRYGDYGIVGFYALRSTTRERALTHFVFSCRTMNMGIEQFVYDYLGKPELTVAGDLAYGLETHKCVDWITVQRPNENAAFFADNRKLLLVGGCELLQLASYCGSNRTEFVNKVVTIDGADYTVRYDDPYFFISDREAMHRDETLATWTNADAQALDRATMEADVIIVAMRAALRHQYVATSTGLRFRMEEDNIRQYVSKKAEWFKINCSVVAVGTKERLTLIENCFEIIDQRSRADASIFIIGASLHKPINPYEQTASIMYNKRCENFCKDHGKFHFVNVSEILPAADTLDDQHFTALGSRSLSQHIMNALAEPTNKNIQQWP